MKSGSEVCSVRRGMGESKNTASASWQAVDIGKVALYCYKMLELVAGIDMTGKLTC